MDDAIQKMIIAINSEKLQIQLFKEASIDYIRDLLMLSKESGEIIKNTHPALKGKISNHYEVSRQWCINEAMPALHRYLRFRYSLCKNKENIKEFLLELHADDNINVNRSDFIETLLQESSFDAIRLQVTRRRERFLELMKTGV